MKKQILFFATCLLATTTFSQTSSKLHQKAIVADGHNDVISGVVVEQKLDIGNPLPKGHTDIPRLKKGGVDIQFFSIFTGPIPTNKEGVYYDANEQIDSLEAITNRYAKDIVLAKTTKQIKKAIKKKKIAALIGVEGGHMIENDLAKLEALHKRGMRYLTLTWNNTNEWASSAKDEFEKPESLQHKGLTDFGKQVVRRMNELGVMVDLSHVGEQSFYDALAVTTKPVILSHSSVWALCPVFRNVKDDQIKAVAKNKGVICINYYSGFISRKFDERMNELTQKIQPVFKDSMSKINTDAKVVNDAWRKYYRTEMDKVMPTLSDVVDHIDYIVKLVGDDYVGLGSDYDGVSSLPIGLEDVTTYPKITEELLRRGYSKKSIEKILGGNVMRVMKANF